MALEKNIEANISKTMILPLWARVVEQTKKDPILVDPEAQKILERIGYDVDFLDPKKSIASQVGCCIRGAWIDDEVRRFMREHNDANVIQLGAGLDDRYRRLGCPKDVHWYDLDLPDVMTLREKAIQPHPEVTCISQSLFEEEWMTRLAETNRPTLIVVEGVLMYFTEEEVRDFIVKIARHFHEVWLLIDFCPFKAIGHAKYHDTLSKMKEKVDFTFSLKDIKEIETWQPGLTVEKIGVMSDLRGAEKFPRIMRWCYKIPYFYRNFNQRMSLIHLHS